MTVQGRRLPDDAQIGDLKEPGDYLRHGDILWFIAPDGMTARVDHRWGLEEHEDGSLSVVAASPGEAHSIWINKPEGWHGYLTRGELVDA